MSFSIALRLKAESRAIEETFAPDAMNTLSDWILRTYCFVMDLHPAQR